MSFSSQQVWVVAPTEKAALEIASKHVELVCRNQEQAQAQQMRLVGRGYKWSIWEMTFTVNIEKTLD